jgi:peroxin-5
MADCGATGSAIDRTAAGLITSVIGGVNGQGNEVARAGKAISSFIGGVATTGGRPMTVPGSLMPAAPPQAIVHDSMAIPQGMDEANINNRRLIGAQANSAYNIMNQNPGMVASPMNMNNPMQMNMQMNHPHPSSMQMQSNMNMHMQMNMNMMHQQMKMMQMAQQQKQHQQRERALASEQKQRAQAQKEQLDQEEQLRTQNTELHQENEGQDYDDWHDSLEEDFQSYLETYQNNIQADAASTVEDKMNTGHEGNVDGASIERLAAAWAEAEEDYSSTGDYANLAASSSQVEENTHQHYEFSETSELYGLQDKEQKGNNEFVDLMSEGMKHFNEGNTAEAIKCFESELRNVDADNSDAWLMLGKCHAENDEDRKAIICLENSVERDPYSSEALLSLGVSYVNELNHEKALIHLNNWVKNNPTYSGLEHVENSEQSALMKLKSLLNRAKEFDEKNGNVEKSVDVLETLGVVCNVTREYEEGVQCLQAAANARPENYQLWNKLGATLANSNRSEEAQHAYHKALTIKPKYARSWLNLAISHSNLQNFDESARCYLQTLSLNPGATHVWSYLRIALTCSEKWDLLPIAASQDLESFKQHYDFVQYS